MANSHYFLIIPPQDGPSAFSAFSGFSGTAAAAAPAAPATAGGGLFDFLKNTAPGGGVGGDKTAAPSNGSSGFAGFGSLAQKPKEQGGNSVA